MNSNRPRVREVGINIGEFLPGRHNAITDVHSIKIGHATIIDGYGKLKVGVGPVRTGVTAIIPHARDLIEEPVEASYYVFNGAGTTTGLSLIDEFGLIETPILLTNTLSVGAVYDAVVQYIIKKRTRQNKDIFWFNPVVGETCDWYLNDIGGLHVKASHVFDALNSAKGGQVEEGNVGAGTGTGALGFKAGIGTSSRIIAIKDLEFTVGVLVQSNFGGSLIIKGVPVGKGLEKEEIRRKYGSIMVIIATDIPLSHRQLKRAVKRATLGLTRTGWIAGHGSGDYFIGFSTSFRSREWSPDVKAAREEIMKREQSLNLLFQATADATEEAILNSIFKADTLEGRDGHFYEGLPIEKVLRILKRYRQL